MKAKIIYVESGKHRIDGVDVAVEDVLALLEAGMNAGQIEDHFPELTEEDVKACVSYAIQNIS